MAHIYYNSWLESYKKPYGAIKENHRATFTINVPMEDVVEVQFVIRKENGAHGLESYLMKQKSNGNYQFTYVFNQGFGLYFYYFKIKQLSNGGMYKLYYGSVDGNGGEGQVYGEEYGVKPYQITCFKKSEAPPEWYRESVFYQIFPDRFSADHPGQCIQNPKKNSFIYGRREDEPYYIKDSKGEIVRWDFYGGNLQGIIQKIPYLKELGVNALYLNPIFEASSNHRYDTADYMQIDSVLGDEETFQRLIELLHENDMRIILDGVFSHVGKNSVYFNYDGTYGDDIGAYQSKSSPFYQWFTFEEYPEKYRSWWGVTDLPEVNKNDRTFQEFIYGDYDSVLSKWNKFGVDGWRLDVADELPDFFIHGIRTNLDSFPDKVLIGEVWEDASKKIAYDERKDYILGDMLHGVMNYPFRNAILDLLTHHVPAKKIANDLAVLQENYPRDVFYNSLNNIGTHDTERILTLCKNNYSKVNLAIGMMCMLPGIPCVYYGDEVGLTGGKDPENRKFYPWGRENRFLLKSFKKWIHIRKESNILKHGEFIPFYAGQLFGILRYQSFGYIFYIINPTNATVKMDVDEFVFTRNCPLEYDKVKAVLDGIEIAPLDGYFVAERYGIKKA